jgi:hypothetical protein
MTDEFDPKYIFALHDVADEKRPRSMLRVHGANTILSELVSGILAKKNCKSFRGAFFKYDDLRQCFLGEKYVTSTLQIRGVYSPSLETVRRLLCLFTVLSEQGENFYDDMCRKLIKECEFTAGPQGKPVKLPSSMTPELAFICGVLHGDGGFDKEKIRISHGLSYVKRPTEQHDEGMGLVRRDLKMVSDLFLKIFNKNVFKLACSTDNYDGIVITSQPIIRFFSRVLQHPIGSKNYDSGIWNKDKLVIPTAISNCKNKSILKAYLCGLISTDGNVRTPYRSGKFCGVSLSGISEIIHDVGHLVESEFGAKVYFCKRRSTSRGEDFRDSDGNYVYRYEIILPQYDFVKNVFDFPFAYPSKRIQIMQYTATPNA